MGSSPTHWGQREGVCELTRKLLSSSKHHRLERTDIPFVALPIDGEAEQGENTTEPTGGSSPRHIDTHTHSAQELLFPNGKSSIFYVYTM